MRLVGKFPRMGYIKKDNGLQDLIKCGLVSYNKYDGATFIEKVGKTERDTVRGKALEYGVASYIKQVLFANLPLTYIDNTTKLEVVSAFDANGEFLIPTNSMSSLTVEYNSNLHTLDIPQRQANGTIPLINSGEPIIAQQYLSPVIPTVLSYEESLQDKLGVTFADGSQYFDQAMTLQIDVGTPITGDNAYVDGVRITPEFNGAIKKPLIVCDVSGVPTGGQWESGAYAKFDQEYDGVPNVLPFKNVTMQVVPYDSLANITDDQLFVTIDKQELGLFETAISGDCYGKALDYFKLGSAEHATDSEGGLIFDVDGNPIYTFALNNGVTTN